MLIDPKANKKCANKYRIRYFRFNLFNLKLFGEVVPSFLILPYFGSLYVAMFALESIHFADN